MNRRRRRSAVTDLPPRRPGWMAALLVAAVAISGGCSLLLPERETERPPDRLCRRSRVAPIADTAVGGAAAVAATALALTPCDGDDRHNFCNGGKEIVAIATVVTGLVFAGSAAYGYVVAADCTRAPPSQLPPFSLATPTGRVIRTDELRGQIVVIDFWAGWCRPCIRAEPKLRDLAREFAEHRVTFVAVNIEAADVALPEYGGDDIVVLRDGGQLAQSAGITSLPSYLIYDRRGQLAARIGGTGRDHLAEIRAELEELIHER